MHRVCGALLALPPQPLWPKQPVPGSRPASPCWTAAIAKINGIAVDETSRGRGIGRALLGICLTPYFPLDYLLAFGQFRAGSGLENYCRRLGFGALAPGDGISLSERLTMPISGSRICLPLPFRRTEAAVQAQARPSPAESQQRAAPVRCARHLFHAA